MDKSKKKKTVILAVVAAILALGGIILFAKSGKKTESSQTCGGIAGDLCPAGYQCVLEGDYPDASGFCRK